MSNKKNTQKTQSKNSSAQAQDLEFEANVLFQKIFNKWYAFSTKDDECFMTEVSEQEIHKVNRKNIRSS